MHDPFRFRRLMALFAVAVLILAACGDSDESSDTGTDGDADTGTDSTDDGGGVTTGDGIVVQAGLNDPDDPTIAVIEYLPESITVESGTEVTWEIPGPEPHSVSFLAEGEEQPAPGSDEVAAFDAPIPAEGPYDGSTRLSSGLGPLGPDPFGPFAVTFDTPGEYAYFCSIHPLMTGMVTVVDEGADADAPDDVTARGDEERDEWLAEGRAAKQALVEADAVSETNDDGSTTWTVEMGTTTEHTDILAFAPTPADVATGDTVSFVNNSGAPHTATFGPNDEFPQDPTGEDAMAASGEQPLAVSADVLANTGWLPPNAPPGAGPPLAARSFAFTVPDAGEFAYVCLLHVPSGMVGIVSAS